MKEFINKYLTRKNRNIIAIVIIVLGVIFLINYSFFEPTYINQYVATKIYDTPANSYFDDDNFYQCVVDAYNKENNDNVAYTESLTDEQLKSIKKLKCNRMYKNNKIKSVTGLNKLTNLVILNLAGNQIETIDLSKNIKLIELDLGNNNLTTLNVSYNTNLESLFFGNDYYDGEAYNNITNIDLSNNAELLYLTGYNNNLSGIDISNNKKLLCLGLSNNNISTIDLSNNNLLIDIGLSENNLKKIDVTNNTQLVSLYLSMNYIEYIDLTNNVNLEILQLFNNSLSEIDLSKNLLLKNLNIENRTYYLDDDTFNNVIEEIDLSNNLLLEELKLGNNYLEKIKLSNNFNLSKLSNSLGKQNVNQSEINVGDSKKIVPIADYNFYINEKIVVPSEINVSEFIDNLGLYNLSAKVYDADVEISDENIKDKFILKIYSDENEIQSIPIRILNSLLFSDEVFYNCVIDGYNKANGTKLTSNDKLSDEQLLTITELYCSYDTLKETITDTTGIHELKNLEKLDLANQSLKTIDLSKNKKLEYIDLRSNELSKIDLSSNLNLKKLYIYNNDLTSLDVSANKELEILLAKNNNIYSIDLKNNEKLTALGLSYNKLSNIDISKNILLERFAIGRNNLDTIDVSKNTKLYFLSIGTSTLDKGGSGFGGESEKNTNKIKSIDLSNNKLLETLDLGGNKLTKIDLSNNAEIIQLDLSYNQLTSLDLKNNSKIRTLYVYNNALKGSIDLSNLSNLTWLYLENNNLNMIDLSNNLKLERLDISNNNLKNLDLSNLDENKINEYKAFTGFKFYNNPYSMDVWMYIDETLDFSNDLGLVKYFGSETGVATNINCDNENIIIDENNISSNISGLYEVNVDYQHNLSSSNNYYTAIYNVYVLEATSNKYIINHNNNYIYTGNDTSSETILNNINLNYGTKTIENNKLLIKYNDEILKEYIIINISSDKYPLNKEYIYMGDIIDVNSINVLNGETELIDNTLLIKYGDEILDRFVLISYDSNIYDLSKEYIYVGNNELNIEDINITNAIVSTQNNKLLIKYDDKIIDEYKIVSISSDVYDLSKEYIYVGTKNINIDNIKVINGTVLIQDNKVVIKYNDEILDEYNILKIRFNNYNSFGKNIIVLEEVSYNDFITNIEVSNGITYKLFNGEEEVTSGNVLVDYILKIYYNDIVIDEHTITDENEYLEFDESLDIDEDNTIINNIKVGTNINSVMGKINTSGNVSVLDKNDNVIEDSTSNLGTGYKFKIKLYSQTLYYAISVRGDINGDRQVNINDVIGVSKHVIKGNVISGIEYVNASDVNDNGNIDINDVIKLAKHIIKNTEL